MERSKSLPDRENINRVLRLGSDDLSGLDVSFVDPAYRPKVLTLGGALRYEDPQEVDDLFGAACSKVLVLYSGGTIGMQKKDGVYCPAPNCLVPALRKFPMLHDKDYAEKQHWDEESQLLILPMHTEGKRVVYTVLEYDPLLDSSNMTMTDWARLAADIKENYIKYDGFVILHGTDTMAFTASALSFMMEDIGKPVILTGSQIPIFEVRSDGRDNFLGAIIVAGHFVIPEVCLYFHNKLMRGNRTTKCDSGSLDAFHSPNIPPIAEMEIDIKIDWAAIHRPRVLSKFHIHTNLCPDVALLRLFPSITLATVKAFLNPPMQGLVIQTYGAGNGPNSRQDLLDAFREAADRGLLIVSITQCARGSVSAAYAAGKAMEDAGILFGGDMTPEAALTKLSYILGKVEWDLPKKKRKLSRPLRGEMTQATLRPEDDGLGAKEFPLVDRLQGILHLSSSEEVGLLKDALYPSLLCKAAKEGNIANLEKLRLAGAVITVADYDGRSALHVAASEGHAKVVKYLLDSGAHVHMRDRHGCTPLDDAVTFKHLDVIGLLRIAGGHITRPPGKVASDMCGAAMRNDVDHLRAWIMAGADINLGDYEKKRPLHIAVSHQKKDAVHFLLDNGASPYVMDNDGKNSFDIARKSENEEIMEVLEKYKGNTPTKSPSQILFSMSRDSKASEF